MEYSYKNHYSKIDSNLTSVNGGEFIKTLDFEIFKEKIYISKVIKKDNCFYLIVDSAELNSKLLKTFLLTLGMKRRQE